MNTLFGAVPVSVKKTSHNVDPVFPVRWSQKGISMPGPVILSGVLEYGAEVSFEKEINPLEHTLIEV